VGQILADFGADGEGRAAGDGRRYAAGGRRCSKARAPSMAERAAPRLGEHSDAMLAGPSYDEATRERLRAAGVIG
jgi:crotonobetainyl-CoA:carnitine CoA-transferase CaiB-like acyl-CoA transferase